MKQTNNTAKDNALMALLQAKTLTGMPKYLGSTGFRKGNDSGSSVLIVLTTGRRASSSSSFEKICL